MKFYITAQETVYYPQFFETVEKLYLMYDVPDEVQANLYNCLPDNLYCVGGDVKHCSIQSNAQRVMTGKPGKTRFEKTSKHPDETYITSFVSRLRNSLTYYLSTRCVADYETLFELLISDQLNGALLQGPLNYVLIQEGEDLVYLGGGIIASLADIFVNNGATIAGQKAGNGNLERWHGYQPQ